mmetsp:Transcript_5285/g.15793  ORF Transcript_5285/g.15793 Transcript_5285/m.15793 type:complete len:118 (-) Transcript_5285:837-1190(-)
MGAVPRFSMLEVLRGQREDRLDGPGGQRFVGLSLGGLVRRQVLLVRDCDISRRCQKLLYPQALLVHALAVRLYTASLPDGLFLESLLGLTTRKEDSSADEHDARCAEETAAVATVAG